MSNPDIHWTDHALARLSERFADEGWRIVPVNKMRRMYTVAGPGGKFEVRSGPVVYVCKCTNNGIIVVTVFRYTKRGKK